MKGREFAKTTSGFDRQLRLVLGGLIFTLILGGGYFVARRYSPEDPAAGRNPAPSARLSDPGSLFAATDAETVRRLVRSGANVNERNEEGETPIMLAAEEGRIEVMRALIEAGADLAAESRAYRTIFNYAPDDSVRNVLLAAGAVDPDQGIENADPLPPGGGEIWGAAARMLGAIQRGDEPALRSSMSAASRDNLPSLKFMQMMYPARASFLRGTTNGKRAIVYGRSLRDGHERECYFYLTLEGGEWKVVTHAPVSKRN